MKKKDAILKILKEQPKQLLTRRKHAETRKLEVTSNLVPRAIMSFSCRTQPPVMESLDEKGIMALGSRLGHIENLRKGGSIFVNPPKILKRQLTGYCTSPASSPMGRDNKHGWYEEHEKFVAIAAGSLSSVICPSCWRLAGKWSCQVSQSVV